MTPDMRILGYISLSIKCMRVPDRDCFRLIKVSIVIYLSME